MGGREMIRCIIDCHNHYEATAGIHDLVRIRPPTMETLEKFHQEWRTTLMEVEDVVNIRDLKATLEQKMEESGMFHHEIRMIDIWDIDDEEKYHKLMTIIESRIKRERRRRVEMQEREAIFRRHERNFPSGSYDQRERRDHPPYQGKPAQPIPFQGGKGTGKGSLDRFLDMPANRTHPAPYNGRQMDRCRETGTCYAYNMGHCRIPDCRFKHEMVPVDAEDKRGTAGNA